MEKERRRKRPYLDVERGRRHLRHFFLLRAARVPEGPGRFALQSAYHDPHLDVNELKQQIKNRFVQAKNAKQTNYINYTKP